MGLGSILGAIGGAIAAPFTGGASLIPTIAGAVGQIAGNAAKGSADQRTIENQQGLSLDQLLNQQYGTQQNAQMQAGNLDLERKQFGEQARSGRAKQALIASLLGGGFTPSQVSVPGIQNAQISGGLAQALRNPEAQAPMAELYKQAMLAMQTPDTFTGGQMLTPPTLQQPKGSSTLEKILGGAGLGGSLLSGVAGAVPSEAPSLPGNVDLAKVGLAPTSETLASILARNQLMNRS